MPWSRIKTEYQEPEMQGTEAAQGRVLGWAEAVREALATALKIDNRVFVMGQGVDDPSGMFGTTKNLHKEFGGNRAFDTPLAEAGLSGISVGAALGGMRPVYFHNRPDFLLLAMDQIVNHAAKYCYTFGGKTNVPLVMWACTGRGWGSASQHSQALQGLFAHVPGLKVVLPATCHDAKGLMLSAIADENPVLVLDHRFNFKQKGFVPPEAYRTPIGKAAVRRTGTHATVLTVSHMLMEAFSASSELEKDGISIEIVDIRTVRPLDRETIAKSVAKTGIAVVADTGWKTGGVSAEITAVIMEECFDSLRAPVCRVATKDTPTPAGYTLENGFYPTARDIVESVRKCVERARAKTGVLK